MKRLRKDFFDVVEASTRSASDLLDDGQRIANYLFKAHAVTGTNHCVAMPGSRMVSVTNNITEGRLQ